MTTRCDFWLRRLHTLTGLAFGLFLLEHMFTNASTLSANPMATYDRNVDFLHSIPGLIFIELALLALPLGLHTLYGLYLIFSKSSLNADSYDYGSNIRYILQRLSAVFLAAFLAIHVYTMRMHPETGLNAIEHAVNQAIAEGTADQLSEKHQNAIKTVDGKQSFSAYLYVVHAFRENGEVSKGMLIFYMLAIFAMYYHFMNGVWLLLINTGILVGRSSQLLAVRGLITTGVALSFVSCYGVYRFAYPLGGL